LSPVHHPPHPPAGLPYTTLFRADAGGVVDRRRQFVEHHAGAQRQHRPGRQRRQPHGDDHAGGQSVRHGDDHADRDRRQQCHGHLALPGHPQTPPPPPPPPPHPPP